MSTSNIPLERDGLPVDAKCTRSAVKNNGTVNLIHWEPRHDYEEVNIGELASGSRRVSFTARIVNLYDQSVRSKIPKTAKGCLKVLVKDDTALLLVCQLISFCYRCSLLTVLRRSICGMLTRFTIFVWVIS